MYECESENTGGKLLPFNPRRLMRAVKSDAIIANCARCGIAAMERLSLKLIVTPARISQKEPAPFGAKVKTYKSHRAYTGADTWRAKGGMMGGASGSCRGATGGNGIGVVPRAFVK